MGMQTHEACRRQKIPEVPLPDFNCLTQSIHISMRDLESGKLNSLQPKRSLIEIREAILQLDEQASC